MALNCQVSAHPYDNWYQFNHPTVSIPLHGGQVTKNLFIKALKNVTVCFEARGAGVSDNQLRVQTIDQRLAPLVSLVVW
jgi:hypothetical protein